MSKLRLLFVKEAQAAYISHLDLMRTFQRCFPRTELDIRHTQGYHPHPIISIVLPLPVGQSSDCELLDFEVTQDTDGSGIADKLNTGMPTGIRVLDCYAAKRPVRELDSLRADVALEYDAGVPEGAAEQLQVLLSRDSLVIQKRTKRKELADVDIAPMIRNAAVTADEHNLYLDITVQAQNPGLNPQLVEKAIATYLPQLTPDFIRVRRRAILDADGQDFRCFCRKTKNNACISPISMISYHGVKRAVLCRRCGMHPCNGVMNTYKYRRKNPWISSKH